MLWLCLHLPRLPLDALGEPRDTPAAVVVTARGRRRLLACNAAARALGLDEGVEASAAQAIAPTVALLPRAPRAEGAALEGIAAWAYQFTDRLVIEAREDEAPFFAVLAELSGSLSLFGGLLPLCARLAESFAELRYEHRLALAPTPAAAEALARAGDGRPVTRLEELRARLAPLTLDALELPADVRAALWGVGVRTVGECLALPPDQLARRFGQATVLYLRRLLGEAPDVRPLYTPPASFRRRFEFMGPIENVEALMFPLKRLLHELQGVLVARDTAVLRLTLDLEHEDAPPTRVALNLAAPRRDAQALLGLLRERLDGIYAAAPVMALVLRVEEFAEPADGQQDLFDDRGRRDDSVRQLVERLVARFGPEAVRNLLLCDDFRPEKSFTTKCHCERSEESGPGRASKPDPSSPQPAPECFNRGAPRDDTKRPRPLWLLREPRALRAAPPRVSKPERIESGWWDGGGIARDYYVAETASGSRLWVFREQGQWFLHGIWA